jgi:hypothetical protein
VKFHVLVADKLKDVCELALTVNDGNAILAQVPLAIRSQFTKENEVDVQFLIRKDWINQAVLAVRCPMDEGAPGNCLFHSTRRLRARL